MPSRSTTRQSSTIELEPPQPVRVENVVAKRLMHYVLTLEEMEIFLKQRFRECDGYDFEVRVSQGL